VIGVFNKTYPHQKFHFLHKNPVKQKMNHKRKKCIIFSLFLWDFILVNSYKKCLVKKEKMPDVCLVG
jgi:hypothetical protein